MSTVNLCTRTVGGIAGVFAALLSSLTFAQSYPTRPIELVVHTSAGSGTDVVARALAEIVRREQLLPQPFVVVNRVGGAGMLAYTYFKTKRGDPYSVLTVSPTLLAMAHRPDVNISLDHYTPLALFAIDPQTIMVPADSPFATFKELVDTARQQPDSLVAATTSVQGTGRLVLYLIEKAVPGAKFKFVTFKGGGEAVTSVAGGHTHFTTENLSEGLGLVEAKKLRVLAVTADRRLPHIPDVPTLQELGYAVQAGTIRGFTFPAGVPKEAVATMEAALERAHKTPAWKEHAARNMYLDTYMGSAEFSRFLAKRLAEAKGFYNDIGLGAKP
ncbi:MAG: Bug family tripartite tricarboxylate transporter substrate binding protein [Burkholderiales bacterium]